MGGMRKEEGREEVGGGRMQCCMLTCYQTIYVYTSYSWFRPNRPVTDPATPHDQGMRPRDMISCREREGTESYIIPFSPHTSEEHTPM